MSKDVDLINLYPVPSKRFVISKMLIKAIGVDTLMFLVNCTWTSRFLFSLQLQPKGVWCWKVQGWRGEGRHICGQLWGADLPGLWATDYLLPHLLSHWWGRQSHFCQHLHWCWGWEWQLTSILTEGVSQDCGWGCEDLWPTPVCQGQTQWVLIILGVWNASYMDCTHFSLSTCSYVFSVCMLFFLWNTLKGQDGYCSSHKIIIIILIILF